MIYGEGITLFGGRETYLCQKREYHPIFRKIRQNGLVGNNGYKMCVLWAYIKNALRFECFLSFVK